MVHDSTLVSHRPDDPNVVDLAARRAARETGSTAPVTGRVVEHQGERVPVLPAWLMSRTALLGYVKRLTRVVRWHAAFHAVRLPLYAGRVLWLAMRGAAVVMVRVWPWLSAADHTEVVADADDAWQRIALKSERWRVRRRRFGLLFGAAASAVGGTAVYLPPLAVVGLVSAGIGALAVTGRRDGASLVDEANMPTTVALAPDHLNDAFRAVGLLPQRGQGEAPPPKLTLCAPILQDGNGWSAVIDLPRGTGKTADDVLAKRTELAKELGADEIQLIMTRVRAAAGGHAGRVSLWLCNDDPYLGRPTMSPMESAESWSVWDPIPMGADARGRRVELRVMWQSLFFGGLPRRGKTFTQRLVATAGVLDPWCRHYVADGKGGADWMPIRGVAHRFVSGAEDDELAAFQAMIAELLVEMERRFKVLRSLPASVCPEGKLTPEIMRRYDMPVIFVTIDELQEYFTALDKDDREQVVNNLCRIARRGPAAGFVSNFASQRPDAESVPPKLREIISYRYCTQVVDKTSSDMVLGKGKAAQGADASVLSEEHQGVGVLVTGPANYVVVKSDYLDNAAFTALCARGRKLRKDTGTLCGDAIGDVRAAADEQAITIVPLLSDVLDVMRHRERIHTVDLLAGLANLDEDTYADYDADRLAAELERAGVLRQTKQVKIDGVNRGGYRRADIEDAVPVELLDRVAGSPTTQPATERPAAADGGTVAE